MKAHYVEALHLPGITGLPNGVAELAIWSSGQSSALLTKEVDGHLSLADRVSAAGHGILTGLFASAKGPPADQIAAALADIRSERAKTYNGGVFLIFQTSQSVEPLDLSKTKDAGEFLVGLDLADTPGMKQTFAKLAQPCVAAVCLLMGESADPRIRKVASAIYFTDESVTKPIFSYTLTFGGGTAYVSMGMEQSTVDAAQGLTDSLASDKGLEKVSDLYIHSFSQSDDSFRAFLSAWTAFEIFVHQRFKTTYGPQWFKHLEESSPASASGYFHRIKEVMSDKHRLLDKFTVIASLLAPEEAEKDITEVIKLKKVRDDIVHTATAGNQYPAAQTQRLIRKYLRLHLESAGKK
jgi:hypothetical protein